ncbi:MAG: MFS transporter [Actinobacteria bacterium]|nr:MFS transporter [Actinomycetota bacterium]
MVSASISIPILGRLGDMFGKRRMLVIALVVLVAGLLVSALADSVGLLIVGRLIQGVGGAVFPLSFGIIRDEFPPKRVPAGIAMVSSVLGIGGGLGIALAGPIVDHLSYHWIFWIPAIAVGLCAVGLVLFVPESPIRTQGRVDVGGALLLAGWLSALLIGVTEGGDWGWTSGGILALFAASAFLAASWVALERRVAEPLVDMRMLRLRTVWTTNLCGVLFGFGMLGLWVLVPQFVSTPTSSGYGFGATVTEAGLFMLPSAGTMLLFGMLSGRLSRTVGSRLPLLLGSGVSVVSFALLAFAHSSQTVVYVANAITGAGIGLAWASMANLIVGAVPPEQTGVATGMNTLMRTVGGAIGAQVTAAVVASRVGSSGIPDETGFTIGFAICSAALLVTALAGLLVPAPPRRALAALPLSGSSASAPR